MAAIQDARAKGTTDFDAIRAPEAAADDDNDDGKNNNKKKDGEGLSSAASQFLGKWSNYQKGRLDDGAAMPGAWKDYKWGWQRQKGF